MSKNRDDLSELSLKYLGLLADQADIHSTSTQTQILTAPSQLTWMPGWIVSQAQGAWGTVLSFAGPVVPTPHPWVWLDVVLL